MNWEIEVRNSAAGRDVHGKDVLHQVRDLGLRSVDAVESARLFYLDTPAPRANVAGFFLARLARAPSLLPGCPNGR